MEILREILEKLKTCENLHRIREPQVAPVAGALTWVKTEGHAAFPSVFRAKRMARGENTTHLGPLT